MSSRRRRSSFKQKSKKRSDEFVSPLLSQSGTARARLVRSPSISQQTTRVKKNRRTKSIEAPKLDPRKKALVAKFAKLAGIFAVVILAAASVTAAYEYASRHQAFAIEAIDVDGLSRAKRDVVLSLGEIAPGRNLLTVSPGEVEANIERHPWIASARVRRVFPRRLSVVVEEHEPVALVALDHLYYVSSSGEIVKRRAPTENDLLPVITGFSQSEIETSATARAELSRSVDFLFELKRTLGDDAPVVSEIHYDALLGVSFIPQGETVRVNVGRAPWADRIRQYSDVRSELAGRGLQASEISLVGVRRPDRVVARMVVASAAPKSGD